MVKSEMIVKHLDEIGLRKPTRTNSGSLVKKLCGKDSAQRSQSLDVGYMWWAPGTKLALHYHDAEELQIILYGSCTVRDIEGTEHQLRAGSLFLCPPGPGGAHEITNTSDFPMCLLFIYPTHDYQMTYIQEDTD